MSLPRKVDPISTTLLQKIKEALDQLNEKMEVMIEIQKHEQHVSQDGIPDVLDVMTLLSLPDHLRKTAVTLCKLEHATADQVAEQTKRARAVESLINPSNCLGVTVIILSESTFLIFM